MASHRALSLTLVLAVAALAACDKPKDRTPPTEATGTAPVATGPDAPPPPAWASALMGQSLTAAQFTPSETVCVGNTEAVNARYGGTRPGVEIVGWGWDPAAKAAIGKILLTDDKGVIVGAGQPGVSRPDVPAARPDVTSPDVGWSGVASVTMGVVEAWGVAADGKSLCRLGRLEVK